MWGQDKLCKRFPQVQGIIPTRVGTSYEIACYFLLISGSSPRVWGQALQQTTYLMPVSNHPHACGDKHCCSFDCRRRRGSSPRVWGQEDIFQAFALYGRIIPTRVGTRMLISAMICAAEDHPHACGDK